MATNPPDLTGRKALIMAAAGDAARAIALAFAEAGADVALTTATPDAEEAFELRRLAKRIGGTGRRTMVESVDMSLGTSVQVAVRQVAKELGGIDLLVAAPDLRLQRPAERMSDVEWSRVVNLNLSGVFYACRSVGREMLGRDGDGGRIIVLLPALDELETGTEQSAAYVAAKAGAEALVQALAREWAPRINVNAIALPQDADEASIATAAASTALWLASEADDSVSGQVVPAGDVEVRSVRRRRRGRSRR